MQKDDGSSSATASSATTSASNTASTATATRACAAFEMEHATAVAAEGGPPRRPPGIALGMLRRRASGGVEGGANHQSESQEVPAGGTAATGGGQKLAASTMPRDYAAEAARKSEHLKDGSETVCNVDEERIEAIGEPRGGNVFHTLRSIIWLTLAISAYISGLVLCVLGIVDVFDVGVASCPAFGFSCLWLDYPDIQPHT